jgi:sulfur relay (sulfurtransferase) DsrF/TusC family protein
LHKWKPYVKATDPNGYRTILAYTAEGHKTRVNYYSNPSIVLAATGTPTGIEGLSNNAAVLLLNRFQMEKVGDESGECLWMK